MSTPQDTCPHCGADHVEEFPNANPADYYPEWKCGSFLERENITRDRACYERELSALRQQFAAQARDENDLRLNQIERLEKELEQKDSRIAELEHGLRFIIDKCEEGYDPHESKWILNIARKSLNPESI